MNYSKFRITLDIHKHQSQVSIPVMYGDTAVQLLVTLTDGGMPYVIGKSCWAQFVANKPDGSEPLVRNCVIENNTVIRLDFDGGIADVAGVYDCEIRLYGAEGKLTSPCFTMVVDARVVADNAGDEATNDFIDQIGTTMAEFRSAEDARESAEAERVTAEEERIANETEAKVAERLRGLAEAERVADEDARKAAETSRESAESERIRILKEINERLPLPGVNDHGKYLKVDGNKWVVSDAPFIAPRLHAPVIDSIDSRAATVAFSEQKNGDFDIKYKVFVDGEAVVTTDEKSADFSAHVGDKIECSIGVAATGDGFLDSSITEGRWGLTNGSKGLTYKKVGEEGNYALVNAPAGFNVGSITVASYFEGKEVTEISGVFKAFSHGDTVAYPYQSVYDAITFLRSVDVIEKSFRGCRVGRLYLPGVNEVFNSFVESDVLNGQRAPTEIQRLYSLGNLPEIITNAVTDLSPDNGFRRINTWCTGVGDDGEFEWAYKPDNTVRVTYYMRETDVGYRDITIPDVIDGMPVNGLGKFFLLSNGYITGVTFGDNMRDINDSAMRNCSRLASIKFGKGLESIGEHAFRYAPVTELDFSGCPKLAEIKGRAFSNCSKLTRVTMPRSVKTIGSTAFASCSALKDIYVPWGEGEVAGDSTKWGASGATIHYNSEV